MRRILSAIALSLLVLLALAGGAEAGKRAKCRRACDAMVAACITSDGLRAKCRARTIRACVRDGLAACAVATTTTTTTLLNATSTSAPTTTTTLRHVTPRAAHYGLTSIIPGEPVDTVVETAVLDVSIGPQWEMTVATTGGYVGFDYCPTQDWSIEQDGVSYYVGTDLLATFLSGPSCARLAKLQTASVRLTPVNHALDLRRPMKLHFAIAGCGIAGAWCWMLL